MNFTCARIIQEFYKNYLNIVCKREKTDDSSFKSLWTLNLILFLNLLFFKVLCLSSNYMCRYKIYQINKQNNATSSTAFYTISPRYSFDIQADIQFFLQRCFNEVHAFFLSNAFSQLNPSVAQLFHELSFKCCVAVA